MRGKLQDFAQKIYSRGDPAVNNVTGLPADRG